MRKVFLLQTWQKLLVMAVSVVVFNSGCVQTAVEKRELVVDVRDQSTGEPLTDFYVVQVYDATNWYYEWTEGVSPKYYPMEAYITRADSGDTIRQEGRHVLDIPLLLGHTTKKTEVWYSIVKDGYLPSSETEWTLQKPIKLIAESSIQSSRLSPELYWWWPIEFLKADKIALPFRKEVLLLLNSQFERLADRFDWDNNSSEAHRLRLLATKYGDDD